MRRGAGGRDLRPSGAPTLVPSSTPPPRALREPATLAAHWDCKQCALGGGGRRCSLRHAALVPAVAVRREDSTLFMWLCGGPAGTTRPVSRAETPNLTRPRWPPRWPPLIASRAALPTHAGRPAVRPQLLAH